MPGRRRRRRRLGSLPLLFGMAGMLALQMLSGKLSFSNFFSSLGSDRTVLYSHSPVVAVDPGIDPLSPPPTTKPTQPLPTNTNTNTKKNPPPQSPQQQRRQKQHQTTQQQKHQKQQPHPNQPQEHPIQRAEQTSSLLDFAIMGFPKCGTTALQEWLGSHPELATLAIPKEDKTTALEPDLLLRRQPLAFARELYNFAQRQHHQTNNSTRKPRIGYKQPGDVFHPHSHQYLGQHWPDTKILVAVRHPVLWFESYVNWRRGSAPSDTDTDDDDGKERLKPRKSLTVTAAQGLIHFPLTAGLAQFHVFLALMGKTPQEGPEFDQLLKPFLKNAAEEALFPFERTPNPVFLIAQEQLGDPDPARREKLAGDLTAFLGLGAPLPPPPLRGVLPEQVNLGFTAAELAKHRKQRWSICGPSHAALREKLLAASGAAADWISHHFVPAEGVVVSDADRLRELLEEWKIDPCDHNDLPANTTTTPVTKPTTRPTKASQRKEIKQKKKHDDAPAPAPPLPPPPTAPEEDDLPPTASNATTQSVPRRVYMYWDKGWDQAPPIAVLCSRLMVWLNPNYEVLLLDDATLPGLVTAPLARLPPELLSNLTVQARSDVYRTLLLHEHGGIWADATVLANQPFDEFLNPSTISSDLWSFRREHVLNDPKLYEGRPIDPWVTSWFLVAPPLSTILSGILEVLEDPSNAHLLHREYFWWHRMVADLGAKDASAEATLRAFPSANPSVAKTPTWKSTAPVVKRRHEEDFALSFGLRQSCCERSPGGDDPPMPSLLSELAELCEDWGRGNCGRTVAEGFPDPKLRADARRALALAPGETVLDLYQPTNSSAPRG